HSATTQLHTLSLHDALPIFAAGQLTADEEAHELAGALLLARLAVEAELRQAGVEHLQLGRSDERLALRRVEHVLLLGLPRVGLEDRKSTRLNSSHVKSSYAV